MAVALRSTAGLRLRWLSRQRNRWCLPCGGALVPPTPHRAFSVNPVATVVDDVEAAAVTLTDEQYYSRIVEDQGVEVRLCSDESRGRGLYATQDFQEGDIVFTDSALLISTSHDLLAATHFRMQMEAEDQDPDFEIMALKKLQGLMPFREDAQKQQLSTATSSSSSNNQFLEVDAEDAEQYSNHCHVCFESLTPVVEAGEEVMQRSLTDQDVAKILNAIPAEQYPLQRQEAIVCECPACKPHREHAALYCSLQCADFAKDSGRHVIEALVGGPPGRIRAAMSSLDESTERYDGHWYMVFQTLCQLAAGGDSAAMFLNCFARLCWHQTPQRDAEQQEQFEYILKLFRHWFQGSLSPEDRMRLLGTPQEQAAAEAADSQLVSESQNPFAQTEAYRALQGGLPGYWLSPEGFWRISSVVSTNAFRIPIQVPRIVLKISQNSARKSKGGKQQPAKVHHDIFIRWHENPAEDPNSLDSASVFPLASYMNHACMGAHNIVATAPVYNSTVAFAALRAIKKGEELLWCYNSNVQALEQHYRFKCSCSLCRQRLEQAESQQ